MIRVAAVSYLNTRPFLFGLTRSISQYRPEIVTDFPSRCLDYFVQGKADLALVPVASLLELSKATILATHCIGAFRRVDSVFLFSQRPVQELESVFLDPHSCTSNGLTRVLMEKHWQKQPAWLQGTPDYFEKIDNTTGGVIIGDRAVAVKERFRYAYDLATEWADWTRSPENPEGLPFTFAVWLVRPEKVTKEILDFVRSAFDLGLNSLPEVATEYAAEYGYTPQSALDYFTRSIEYRLDEKKIEAIRLYLENLARIDSVLSPELSFVF
jgi:chorismate dehydratase